METLFRMAAIMAAIATLTACATANYYPYEARNNVQTGKGGTKVVVEGMEIWFNGEPPRTYAILGYIEDSRAGGTLDHRNVPSDVLNKARAVGADALIEVAQPTTVVPSSGMVTGGTIFGGGSTGFGIGIGWPVATTTRTDVKYIAIDYLD